jgi:hypothetical protein
LAIVFDGLVRRNHLLDYRLYFCEQLLVAMNHYVALLIGRGRRTDEQGVWRPIRRNGVLARLLPVGDHLPSRSHSHKHER